MPKWVAFACAAVLTGGISNASEKLSESEQSSLMRSGVSYYNEAKTLRGLIKNMPGALPDSDRVYELLLKDKIDQPLPRLSFDLGQKTLTFDHETLKIISFADGQIQVGGQDYTWERSAGHFTNLKNLFLLSQKKPGAALLIPLVIGEAQAQNRGDFPAQFSEKIPDPLVFYAINGTYSETNDILNVGGYIHWIRNWLKIPAMPAFAVVSRLSSMETVAVVTEYLINKSDALIAPSCTDQVNRLKEIMNQARISLAGFQCHVGSWTKLDKEQTANIEFWTPDKKKLPFDADWGDSTAFVNHRQEVYNFGQTRLSSVSFPTQGRTISSGPQFESYVKRLEPYRKVLYEIGTNNSCWKCAGELQKDLVQDRPETYLVTPSHALANPNVHVH